MCCAQSGCGPAADVPCRTQLELADGRSMGFQEWYARLGAKTPVRAVNAGRGPASSDALDALSRASTVVLGPSDPVSSVGTILTLDGVVEAMAHADRVVAVSPTVGTAPLAGTVAHHALAMEVMRALTRVVTASTAPKVARCSDGSPMGSGHAGGGGRPGRTVPTSAPLGGHHIADDDG